MEAVFAVIIAVASGLTVLAWRAPWGFRSVAKAIRASLGWIWVGILGWTAGYDTARNATSALSGQQLLVVAVLATGAIGAAWAFMLFLEFGVSKWSEEERRKD